MQLRLVLGRPAGSAHFSSAISGPEPTSDPNEPSGTSCARGLCLPINQTGHRSACHPGFPVFEALQFLTDQMHEHRDELLVADVRSIAAPLGVVASEKVSKQEGLSGQLMTAAVVRRRAMKYFVSQNDELHNHVTRLELQLRLDPFSEPAMDALASLETSVRRLLPDALQADTEVLLSDATASLRDLKTVGVSDRNRINVLVTGSVFILLGVVLRRVALTIYLLVTVIFSYLVTLGVTFVVFYLADRHGFAGLDWTVPCFYSPC